MLLKRWPQYEQDEIGAVMSVLESGKVNYWTGDEGRKFEEEFAAASGCRYGIALANGTVALELALKCLSIGPGDEVIVTPYTFIASASAIVMCGATPVFADVDPTTLNISAESIRSRITEKTRAVILVHLQGLACDIDAIRAVTEPVGVEIVEDCAQAHGARYKGRSVGQFGVVAAYSFCQDKIMSTGGEGGMLVTNDENLWRAAWSFKDHGKSYDAMFERSHPPGFRWVHESFGTNWRMTEMQAAIGRVQLGKLDAWVEHRRENARVLTETLDSQLVKHVPVFSDDFFHVYYKYTMQIDLGLLGENWTRARIIEEVDSKGFPCFSGICPEIYRERAFQGYNVTPMPNCSKVGDATLQFLVDPTFTPDDMRRLGDELNQIFERAIV